MNLIEHLKGLVSSQAEVTKGIWTLFKLEAKLAGLNIVPLFVSLGAMIISFMTLWMTAMALLGYLIVVFSGNAIVLGFIGILLLNSGLLMFALKCMRTSIQRMSFEKTRVSLFHNQLRDDNEFSEQAADINR